MQVLVMLGVVLIAVLIVAGSRRRRDMGDIASRVAELGGEVVKVQRTRKGTPFKDTGRGWWAWRVTWRSQGGERTSWALTTREGIKDWRD